MALSLQKIMEECCAPMWWETCIECGRLVSDQEGDWCPNCGQWVCDKDMDKHRKRCLSRKH